MKEQISEILKRAEDPKIKALLCFCRKYRASRETKYSFYKANTNSDVADKLKLWLIENIKSMDFDKLDALGESNGYTIKLDEITKWESFKENAFRLECQELGDLKRIKSNLNNFIIYCRLNDDFIIGQIKKLGPSSVLMKRGYYKLGFENNAFCSLEEEKHVEITKFYDFIFFIFGELRIGFINPSEASSENFESIFDMQEQYQENAKKIIRDSSIFSLFPNPDQILDLVNSDRVVQKMLMNPVSQRGISDAKKDDLKQIKEKLGMEVRFQIKGDSILLQEGKEKDSLKDLIKALGYHYNRTLVGEYLIEGTPKRIL